MCIQERHPSGIYRREKLMSMSCRFLGKEEISPLTAIATPLIRLLTERPHHITGPAIGLALLSLAFSGGALAQTTTWSGLASTVTATPAGGTISLGSDIAYDSGGTIGLAKTLSLQSNVPGTLRTISGRTSNPFRLFNASGANTITLGDLTLSNGGGGDGGALYVNNGTTIQAVPGSTLEFRNNRGIAGGGIFVAGGTVTLENVVFADNITTSYGSGIYVNGASSSLFRVNGNATFTNNANNGGGFGGALNTDRNAEIAGNGTFIGNTTTGRGGAISLNNAPNSRFTTGGTLSVSDSQATQNGGGVYIDANNQFTALGDSRYTGNLSRSNGGAIYNYGIATFGAADAPVTVVFQNNRAGYATALYNFTRTSRTTIYGDVSFIGNITTAAGTLAQGGGALHNDGIVNITGNALFEGNIGAYSGGGSYNYTNGSASITISGNATYTGNTARQFGGAHSADTGSTLTINGDANFQNNTANSRGGALYNNSTRPLTLNVINNDQTYSGNAAYNGGSAPVSAAGGFMYAAAGTATTFNVADSRQLTIGTCVMDGTDSISSANTNATLNKNGTGILTLSADNSAFQGTWNVSAGTLRAGCANTFTAPATHIVAGGAALSANGFDQSVRVLTNGGSVLTGSAASAPGARLNVTTTYTGASGSQLRLNTTLGDSGSASDVLAAQNTSGTTELFINNIGGAGAATTGNGILVVQVNGTSSAIFTMTPVIAGNYVYSLVKVGNNWYLQSAELPTITVTKNVTGATSGYNGMQFSIIVDCGSDGSKTMSLANGESDMLRVPEGATCTVAETPPANPPGYVYSVSISNPGPFAVPGSGQAVTVTNTLTAQLQPVAITKTVAGDSGGYPPGSTFAISINCGAAGSNSYDLADGQTATFNAPVGASCTVSETTPVNPAGYAYTSDITPASFTVALGGQNVAVTNTLTALPQTITVTKNLYGDIGGYDNARFSILVDCGAAGSSLLKLAAGENGTYQAPTGAACTISEILSGAPAGYSYGSPSISPPSFTVPSSGGVAVTVNNTITALDQPITLQKTISGDVAGYNGTDTFEITLTCDIAGITQVNLARNSSMTIHVPTGDVCEATETAPSNPSDYTYGTPTITPAGRFEVRGGGHLVNVDNALTAQSQSITVTKSVDGDIRGYPAGSTFAITVDCGSDGSKTLNLSNGASGTFDAPTGASCTVSEATPANPPGYVYSTAISEPGPFTVPGGGIRVDVTNTLTAQTQTITVSKYLSGDVGAYPPGTTFPVTISCDGQPPATLNLPASGNATLDAPTGVTCTVAESLPTPPAGYTYETVSVHPAQFSVPADGQTVAITNSLTALGQPVSVTKMVTGDIYGYPDGYEFDITVNCLRAGNSLLHLANGTSGTFNAPTGDVCTITEATPTSPDGFAYSPPDISRSSIVIGAGGNDVVITNRLTAEPQTLTLNKIVSGNTAGYVGGTTFPITITCTPPNGTVSSTLINLAGGGSDATITAPTGAVCYVTEGPIPGANALPGYSWKTPLTRPSFFIMPPNGREVRVINVLSADNQPVSIQKVLGGAVEGEIPGTEYVIDIVCNGVPSSLSLAAGASGTLNANTDDLCSVTEAALVDPAGYTYATPVITPAAFTVSANGNGVVVSNSLTAAMQDITVQKTVTGDTAGYVGGTTFPITITCTPPSGNSSSTTVNLADGGVDGSTVKAPTGSVCTVDETIPPGAAAAGYTWNTPAINPKTFTVPDGGATVNVTNQIVARNQPVTITKNLSAAAPAYDNAPFQIHIDCGPGRTSTLNLLAGQSDTYYAPTGSTCTVSETLPAAPGGYSYAAAQIVPDSFTLPNGGQTVAVTNTLNADPQTITVTKTVAGATAGYDGAPFSMTLSCGGTPTPFTLADGASQSFSVPTGTTCRVAESTPGAPAGYSYATPQVQPIGDFAVAPGVNHVSVTNTLSAANQPITIRNVVTGAMSGYVSGTTFSITINCGGSWGSRTLNLANGGSQTVQVPTGTSCTLSQTAQTNPPGYSYSPPVFNPGDTFTVTAGGNAFTVTNQLNALPQTLSIQKIVVAGSGGYTGEQFSINVNCGGISYTAQLSNGGIDTNTTIPTGTTCNISEVTPADPPGYSYDTPQISPASFTMPPGTQNVTVTNTLVADPTITLNKTVTGDTAGYVPGTPFTVNVICDGVTRVVSLVDGMPDTSLTAPAGAECTVSEDTPTDPSGYSYDTPQISPAGFIMPAGGQTVSVTNNLVQHQPITISVTVGGDASAYPGDPFTISVTCDGVTTSALISGGGTDSTTVSAPPGAICTVTQTLPPPPPGYTYSATISPEQFIMAAGQIITVTNNLLRAATGSPLDIPVNPPWLLLALIAAITGLVHLRQRPGYSRTS